MKDFLVGDDWLALRVGDQSKVHAQLAMAAAPGSKTLSLVLPDWTSLVIEVDDPDGLDHLPAGTKVAIAVRRTEDGLAACSAGIVQGAVPYEPSALIL